MTRASSYLSSNDVRCHFGLAEHSSIQEVRVTWPSGIVQTLPSVGANQFLEIQEPEIQGQE